MPQTEATWADWGKHCRTLIERSDEVWVLKLEGWDTSVGVTEEVRYAGALGRRLSYFACDTEPFTPVP
jgi:hypothetical protein